MKKAFLAFLVLFIPLFAGPTFAWAQGEEEKSGFSVEPFFQDVTIEKDREKAEFDLKISNKTSAPAVFYLSALDFGALDESGGVAFLGSSGDLEKKYGLASWIVLEKDALTVNPGETQIVKVKIENKDSLSPGGHYAAIVLKLENAGQNEGEQSKVNLNSYSTSLIFARKIGGEIYGLKLNKKDFAGNIFALPNKVDLRFQNDGNVHLVPRGTIKIIDPWGREVGKGIINDKSSFILPETFRLFSTSVKKMVPAIVPGKYTVRIEYRYDGKDDFVIEEQKIDIIPLPVILASLIILGLMTGYVFWRRRKKRAKGKKEADISGLGV